MNKEKIFRLLLEYLEANYIPYAILRPTDDYLELQDEGDIDFVISRKEFRRISHHIYNFCEQGNFIPVQIRKHENTACIVVLSSYHKQEGKFKPVKVGFYSDYTKGSRFYLSANELLDNR